VNAQSLFCLRGYQLKKRQASVKPMFDVGVKFISRDVFVL